MKKNLDISVTPVVGGMLTAIDNTDYSSIGVDVAKHVMLDFLSYDGESIPNSTKASTWLSGQKPYAELPLNYDGVLYYYKLVIPMIDHFSYGLNYEGLRNQLFVYNNDIYYCEHTSNNALALEQILQHSRIISNYVEAYELVQGNEGSQTFYFPRLKILVYLKIQECLVKLQKQLLLGTGFNPCSFGGTGSSGGSCATDQALKGKVDFLLAAVYILEYLKNVGNYEEAMRILENLSSCPDLCGDDYGSGSLKGCGCGSSV